MVEKERIYCEIIRNLPIGLAFILAFVGTKMLLVDLFKIPVHYSLIIILTILIMSVSFSLYKTKEEAHTDK